MVFLILTFSDVRTRLWDNNLLGDFIATVLHHDDYEIVREQLVPGRTSEATQLIVRVTAGKNANTVPFTLVRYKESGWLIEQIGLDAITNRR